MIKVNAGKVKLYADHNRKYIKYCVGQLILVRNHQLSNRAENEIKNMFHLYNGPYMITKVISEENRQLKMQRPRKIL